MSEKVTNKEMEYFFRQDEQLSILSDYLDKAKKIQFKKGSCIIASCLVGSKKSFKFLDLSTQVYT